MAILPTKSIRILSTSTTTPRLPFNRHVTFPSVPPPRSPLPCTPASPSPHTAVFRPGPPSTRRSGRDDLVLQFINTVTYREDTRKAHATGGSGGAAAGGGRSEVKRSRAGSPHGEPRTESPSEAAQPKGESRRRRTSARCGTTIIHAWPRWKSTRSCPTR